MSNTVWMHGCEGTCDDWTPAVRCPDAVVATAPDRPLLPEGAGLEELSEDERQLVDDWTLDEFGMVHGRPTADEAWRFVCTINRLTAALRRSEAERRQMAEALRDMRCPRCGRFVGDVAEDDDGRFRFPCPQCAQAAAALRSSSSTPEEAPNG